MTSNYTQSHILILDDDEDDYIITADYLRSISNNFFKIDWASNYNEGLNKIINGNYDISFVDYRLGAKSGIDFLRDVLQNKCDTPVVLLTGMGNYNVDLMAMELGAYDYLVKTEISTEKLERCIRYVFDRSHVIRELKTSEKKYRNIFKKLKDVVFVTDTSLNIIDVNTAVTNLLGYDQDIVMKMNLTDLIEDADQKKHLLSALIHHDEINDWEVTMNTKDGEKKYCLLSVSFQKDDKDVAYIQGIIHDLTYLKRVEKATLQSEKLAATGRLVRTIAHEVRNPLNNLSLSVEQVKHDNKDENMLFYFEVMNRNLKRINNLINNLLNTSYPADTHLKMESLPKIVDEVLAASLDSMTLKKIRTHVSYYDPSCFIMADKQKIKMALMNVVINAIEAMDKDKGLLNVQIRSLDNDAILTIADNGCGMSEDNIAHIFEPYYTNKKNGVGLGLTLTLNILQAHKAKIDVVSVPGQGSTFTITFPMER